MAPDSPPHPATDLRARLFSIGGNGRLDLLTEMLGVAGDGAAILGEEPAFEATAQPGDLLITFLYEGKVRMAYISRIEVGGSDQEEGSSSGSDAKGEDTSEHEEGSSSGSGGKDKSYEEEHEEGSSTEKDDEEEEDQSEQSSTYVSSPNSVTETNNKEGSDTEKEVKEKNHHLHIRIWQEYCVLVFFEGERWKLTKQQPIHWLREDQIEETHERIITENERNEVNMTRSLDFFNLSKQMCMLGFSGRLECSKAVDNFVSSELSPDIIDYDIMEVLGSGASCKVYRADTKYAIKKMVLDKNFDDRNALENKEPREVTILSSFRDSAVVSFFQAWAVDGIYKSYLKGSSSSSEGDDEDSESDDDLQDGRVPRYVAIQMEYCGSTLRKFLDAEDREIDVEEAWFLLKEITKAIQSIHRRGVIHRDLKPANIFFGYADAITVKIGDFGHGCWVKQYAADEGGTPNRGTAVYCAPELEGEKPKASPTDKADMYSLGIILLELFHLFGSEHRRADVLKNLSNDQYPGPADRHWYGDVTLLKKLVASCPSQRPSADETLEYISNHH